MSPDLVQSFVVEIEKQFPGVSLDLGLSRSGDVLILSKIVVGKESRGKGIGSEVMRRLVAFADRHGLRIGLTPSGDFGGSVGRLKRFYRGFGFKPYKGFDHRETMEREPLTSPVSLSEILFRPEL